MFRFANIGKCVVVMVMEVVLHQDRMNVLIPDWKQNPVVVSYDTEERRNVNK